MSNILRKANVFQKSKNHKEYFLKKKMWLLSRIYIPVWKFDFTETLKFTENLFMNGASLNGATQC